MAETERASQERRFSGPAAVQRVDRVARDAAVVALDAPAVAAMAQPGQFVTVRFPDVLDPFLARPFSIHDVEEGSVLLLVRAVGRGSRRLSGLPAGAWVDLVGPLGTGFACPSSPGGFVPAEGQVRHILVGGGMGVAPFPLLLRRLRGQGADVQVLVGARTAEGLYALERLEPARQTIVTEDGRGHRRGLATDLLAETLRADAVAKAVYACGPEAMLEAVAHLSLAAGVPCQISLEAMMACGTGLCHGCVVRLADDSYARVCAEGPVFTAAAVAIPWSRGASG